MDRFFHVRIWAVPLCVLLLVLASVTSVANGQAVTIREINPTRSNTPDGKINAGRVNHLARATDTIFYAASEFGGLFKSTDAGRTWVRLDRYLPTRVSDVKTSPANPNLVIATSLYDGRVNSLAGINLSNDGGATWAKPASASPPTNFCSGLVVNAEPAAFGIAFDPQNPTKIFVGTNCGLARSTDSGLTWKFINPGPGIRPGSVHGVVVHHGGIIDTCGSDGHRRSIDGGDNWDGPLPGGTPLPTGQCSIAVSPDESSVLFATVGTRIFESDNGGGSWDTEFVNPASKGRVTFVVTNDREGRNFDLWFGDAKLMRAGCRTPTIPGPTARCPASGAWIRATTGAHDDMGEVVFNKPPPINVTACHQNCANTETSCKQDCEDERTSCIENAGEPGNPTKAGCNTTATRCRANCANDRLSCDRICDASRDSCPVLLSSDGGTHFNPLTQSPACQTPQWTNPTVTLRALWLWSLSGANIASSLSREAVYMGTQDNGAFVTLNAGAATPSWTNPRSGDVPDVVSDSTQVVFTVWNQKSSISLRNPDLTAGQGKIPNHPPGEILPIIFPDVIARFGARRYGVATTSGIFVTRNISANRITWTRLGTNAPIITAGLWAAGSPTNPTFYAMTANQATLMRYNGLSTTGEWRNVPLPSGFTSVGAFGVDPNNPNRLFISAFVSDINFNTRVQMFRSSDGGANWARDAVLDGLMNGGGTFRMQVQTLGYLQPTLAVFDPNNANTLLAGAADAGIFLSRDNGASWTTVTNNSGDAANPIIPRPYWAYFDRECSQYNIYVGTQGRGAWRFSYRDTEGTTVSSCQARCDSALTECQSECDESHAECLSETGPNKTPPFKCAAARTTCRASCSTPRNICRQRCVDCPE